MALTLWMDHFWKGLASGVFVPKTDKEIREYIEQNHFGGEALIELSEEDKAILLPNLTERIMFRTNSEKYKSLCEKNHQYFPKSKASRDFFKPTLVTEGTRGWVVGKRKIAPEKKASLLSNPDIYLNINCMTGSNSFTSTGPLVGWGMRHIESYGLENPLQEITARIRQRTGRKIVNVLDVGGAAGIALKDVKKQDPQVSTWNMTMDMEPVTYDTDKTYLCIAERFPAELRESADLIISNYSFCYFPCQARALENCLQSLSIGGEAHLNISFGKQDIFVKNSANRMRQEYDRLASLKDSGKIELEVNGWEGEKHALVYQPSNYRESEQEREHFYPPAFVRIRKLKSLA